MSQREFSVSIQLGNEDVREPADAAKLLREIADKLENGTESGTVRDGNGNSVGKFKVNRRAN